LRTHEEHDSHIAVDTLQLAALLYAAPGETAVLLGDVPDWSPRRAQCHANADEWVTMHAGYRAVRGWLRVEYETPPHRIRFHSHSVVEDADGQLIDVTLLPSDPTHRFIRHPWSEAEFLTAVANNGMPSIEQVLPPDDPAVIAEAHRRSAELNAFMAAHRLASS
jgi:hypothetical protein